MPPLTPGAVAAPPVDGPSALTPEPPVGRRRVVRRASLPGGRAVVGGFLVALSAFGIFAAYTSATAGPTQEFAVARHDLPVGTRVTSADIDMVPMELPDRLAGEAAFADPADVVGRTVVGPVRRGELLQAGDVVHKQGGADDLEVSFSISSDRAVAGGLRAGEHVDVVVTFGSGADAYTTVVVRNARVLSAGQGGGALSDGRTQTVTVAVTRGEEALALVHAVNAGEVTLVRTTGTNPDRQAPATYRGPRAGQGGG